MAINLLKAHIYYNPVLRAWIHWRYGRRGYTMHSTWQSAIDAHNNYITSYQNHPAGTRHKVT